ncbi:plasmid mobilization protein [Sphingomonas sp. SORGH_AS_0438]|uniref:plasmid mobilization protein n=1 Tax=Sphingomonas sp. SORGH_AS_0438 TaxID=3041756 RepID=UPI0028676535|nr:uncharacterized protein (DUF1778 family) [Sphingomonas sp. SORGH_AS_0438]
MKTMRIELRASPAEKDAFEQCAEIAGMTLSVWMRTCLRQSAVRELEEASQPVPFLSMKRV